MTCQFSYKGVSVEDCINLCNEETNNLCGSYCENKCKNCQDITKCPWILNTTTLSPTTTTGAPIYNAFILTSTHASNKKNRTRLAKTIERY